MDDGVVDAEDDDGKAPESKRERIVRHAAELFLERGYDSVSINDIIEVVGGSKSTLYAYFGNKEKLFEAVVREMCDAVTLNIDTSAEGTLEEQLSRMAESFVAVVLSPRIVRFHRLMTSIGRTFPEIGRLFYASGPQRAHAIFADWVRTQQARGTIRSDADPLHLAILFHDMLIADSMLTFLTAAEDEATRRKRVKQTVALAVRVFLDGARPPPAAG